MIELSAYEKELLKDLGLRLRKARILKRDKQKHIAARTGISPPIIGKIEKGDPSVSFGRYIKVASALDLLHTLDALFLEKADPFEEHDREVETKEQLINTRVR